MHSDWPHQHTDSEITQIERTAAQLIASVMGRLQGNRMSTRRTPTISRMGTLLMLGALAIAASYCGFGWPTRLLMAMSNISSRAGLRPHPAVDTSTLNALQHERSQA